MSGKTCVVDEAVEIRIRIYKLFLKNMQEEKSNARHPPKISVNSAALCCSFNRFIGLNGRSGVLYPNPGFLGLCYLFHLLKSGSPQKLFFKISVPYNKSI